VEPQRPYIAGFLLGYLSCHCGGPKLDVTVWTQGLGFRRSYKIRRERASTKCDGKDCAKIQENGQFPSAETYKMETVLEAKEKTYLIHSLLF